MSGDFFDPTREQQVVVLVESATLRQAERLIVRALQSRTRPKSHSTMEVCTLRKAVPKTSAPLTIRTGSRELAAVLGDMVFQAVAGSDRLKASLLSGFFKFVEPSSRRLGPDLCDP